MPIIPPALGLPVLVSIIPNTSVVCTLSVASHFEANIQITTTASCILGGSVDGAADVQITTTGSVHLRLNNDPDTFGASDVQITTTASCSLTETIVGRTSIRPETAATCDLLLIENDVYELNLAIDILPVGYPLGFTGLQPRLKVDGTEIPIVNWSVAENANSAGQELTVTLARQSDQSVFTPAALIDFGLGTKTAGVWNESTFETIIDDGKFVGSTGNISFGPNHTVSIQTNSDLNEKLLKTPESGVIFYNVSRLTIEDGDIEPIPDTQGNLYTPDLVPIGAMSTYDLFKEIFVERCEFTEYKTNLPDWQLSRVDCAMGRNYFESIGGYIGMFEPIIFPEGTKIWLVDTSILWPTDWPTPRDVTVSKYQTLSITNQNSRLDGYLVQYSEYGFDVDYTTEREEVETQDLEDGTDLTITQTFREYRKFTQPNIVLRDELIREVIHGTRNLATVYTSREQMTYDSQYRLTGRRKTIDQEIPDLESGGAIVVLRVTDERETREYQSHPFNPAQQIMARQVLEIEGLYTVDATNQQLGEDFKQDYVSAYRGGNLQDGQTLLYGPLKTEKTEYQPQRNGLVTVKTFDQDYLTSVIIRNSHDERPGDIGMPAKSLQQKQVIVFDDENAVRSTKNLETFHAGELPLVHAVPLGRRRLKQRKTKNRTIEAQVIGHDATLKKGTVITAKQFGGTAIGKFIIMGKTISGDSERIITALTCKEV